MSSFGKSLLPRTAGNFACLLQSCRGRHGGALQLEALFSKLGSEECTEWDNVRMLDEQFVECEFQVRRVLRHWAAMMLKVALQR